MDNWDEVRTAYYVVREGTVSGAADALGVHHATVIRHIDALEDRLGVKLFQRHARGYTPTEAGEDLARVARTTDDQLSQLGGRLRGRGEDVTGELVVTSLSLLADVLVPLLAEFQKERPRIRLRYLAGEQLARLEYGEAHVAIRAGSVAPDQPDNVVQHFTKHSFGLFATEDYLAPFGDNRDLSKMQFVGPDDPKPRAPAYRWLIETVDENQIIFRTDNRQAAQAAIRAGVGVGFYTPWEARDHKLVEVMPPLESWSASFWLVTHVDLHRTPKVQALLQFLKANVAAFEL
ncbi:LysR family transcriptional regulator [Primorskyibacter sp. S187A]|uniref:LysR family transcriptional regulator n=1 Tax=Primorskyibacter sp. S187A TaxID=3415130 RepID=UPI003C7A2412